MFFSTAKAFLFSGLFFEKHLKYIKLDEDFVQFTKMNLSYLLKVIRFVISHFAVYLHRVFNSQNNYDKEYLGHVYTRPVVTYEELRRGQVKTTDPVRIQYNTKDQYKRTAKMLGLMDDFKVGPARDYATADSLDVDLASYHLERSSKN